MSNKDDIYKQEYLQHNRTQERRRFSLDDVSGRGNEIEIEVNWNSYARKHGNIKLTINGEETVINRDHLWSILFILGSAEEQEKLASPFMKQTKVTKFFKMIGITAAKDVRKGSMLNVPLEFTLNPDTNEVIIGKGNLRNLVGGNKTGSGLIT